MCPPLWCHRWPVAGCRLEAEAQGSGFGHYLPTFQALRSRCMHAHGQASPLRESWAGRASCHEALNSDIAAASVSCACCTRQELLATSSRTCTVSQ